MHFPMALSVALIILLGLAAFSFASTLSINFRHPPEGRLCALATTKRRRKFRMHIVERAAREDQAVADVVLIHGAFASIGDPLLALADVLCGRYRVIAVDRPGQGWSDRPGGMRDASPARQAALIHEALRAQGMERAIVIGHSLGAAVAVALAIEHKRFVQGLVLVAPATHPWPGGIAWHYWLPALPIVGPLFAGLFAAVLGPILLRPGIEGVFRPQAPPKDYARRAGAALALTPRRLCANGQDVAKLKRHLKALSRRYREIKIPCVIVTGDTDNTVSPRIHSQGLAHDIEGASLVVLEGVGHMPHHAKPDAILAAVDEVVARTKRDVPGTERIKSETEGRP
jgi:pimeloyl-ACP methyl ester carboxylesterase